MKLYIASDHAGFELKQHLVKYLEENGIEVVDCGPETLNPDDDYPDMIGKAAEAVSHDLMNSRGIVIGLSGQGEAMVANKFKGIRAGVYYGSNPEIVTLMRQHNDANVLSLGAKFLSNEEAETAVNTWIETQFTHDTRHVRRIDKVNLIETQHFI